MKPTVWYCYDAYCGWCYGFSPVIKKLAQTYKGQLAFDVLSGGMIVSENPRPVGVIAGAVRENYQRVEELTGIKFGADFLWHIQHPEESDWHPDSLKPAIALSIFKEYQPDEAVSFAADLQYALNFEGRDLTDDEAYRHLVQQYGIDEKSFYEKLHSATYRDNALYEFALIKQLGVTGYPCVLLQVSDRKFYLLANGYTDYETLQTRLQNVLAEVAKNAAP